MRSGKRRFGQQRYNGYFRRKGGRGRKEKSGVENQKNVGDMRRASM
jgi:hypothetical protein